MLRRTLEMRPMRSDGELENVHTDGRRRQSHSPTRVWRDLRHYALRLRARNTGADLRAAFCAARARAAHCCVTLVSSHYSSTARAASKRCATDAVLRLAFATPSPPLPAH